MDKSYEIKNVEGKFADYQIKAVFLGNSGVGKTSIIKYEIENNFSQKIQPTSILQYFSKKYQICDKIIIVQIWDLGGDETYESVLQNFYTSALCIFFVFSFDDKNSFYDLDKWINSTKNEYQTVLPFLILIGNKSDIIDENRITKEEINDFIIKNNIDYYYETSAKNGDNVHEMFEDIIKKFYIKYIEPNLSDGYSTKSSQSTRHNALNPCGIDEGKCKVCDCFIL